jgi:hypothetical protein
VDSWRGGGPGGTESYWGPALMPENPAGRVDVAVKRLAEFVTRAHIEPRFRGARIWDNGLRAIVETAVDESSAIPKNPITAVDVARFLGILKPVRRVRGGPGVR